MNSRRSDGAGLRRPGARPGPAPFLWLGCGLVALTLLLGGGFWVAQRVEVADSRRFGGVLRPATDPTAVLLPAGVPLGQVLVSPGDPVEAGQTLATIDRDALVGALADLRRQILVAAARRECLLAQTPDAAAGSAEGTATALPLPGRRPIDAETRVQLDIAIETCRNTRRAQRIERDRIATAMARLAERRHLLDRKISLILTRPRGADRRIAAEASLSLSLERNQVRDRIETLSAHARRRAAADRGAALAEAQAIGRELAELSRLQTRLTSALARPRIQAPQGGTVARIRTVSAGARYPQAETLVELRASEDPDFIAEISVTQSQAETLPPGTPVRMHLLGLPIPRSVVTGRVETISTARTESDGQIRVTAAVRLTADALRQLTDPVNGIALNGTRTASEVVATLAPVPLADMLLRPLRLATPRRQNPPGH